MLFLPSHPTKAFAILGESSGVLEFQLYKTVYSPYTRYSYTIVFSPGGFFFVLRQKNLKLKIDFFFYFVLTVASVVSPDGEI